MTKDWTNYEPGQRIEATDAIQVAVDTPVQGIQAIARDVLAGANNSIQNYVLDGFLVSAPLSPTLTTVDVTNGTAIVGFKRRGVTEFGMVLSGGAAQKSADMGSLADGTYGVYVRFEFSEDDFANRFFWNPLAVTPVETPRNVGTRLAEDWSFTIDLVSPGPEWLQVASISKTGTTLVVTDQRRYFFDTINGQITNTEWGTVSDRTTPVANLRDMVMALARQVQDGFDLPNWRATPIPALARDGSNTVTGDILPDSPGARDLGSFADFFDVFYGSAIVLQGSPLSSATGLGFISGNELALSGPVFGSANLDITGASPQAVVSNTSTGSPVSLSLSDNEPLGSDRSEVTNTPNATPGGQARLELEAGGGAGEIRLDADNVDITNDADIQGNMFVFGTAFRGAAQSSIKYFGAFSCHATTGARNFVTGEVALANGEECLWDLASILPVELVTTLEEVEVFVTNNVDNMDIDVVQSEHESTAGPSTQTTIATVNNATSLTVNATLSQGTGAALENSYILRVENNTGGSRSLHGIRLTFRNAVIG